MKLWQPWKSLHRTKKVNDLVPVTVFAGYLGSGKTTIIANALSQYAQTPRFALIKNEFGDASIDGTLLRFNDLAVKDILNGCLCCILVGAINPAVEELINKYKPERIIIEASGAAHPFPIILELKKNPLVYLDGVIQVVDCINFHGIKDKSFVGRDMAKSTDLIVFNKTDLAGPDKVYAVKEEIFDINPDTPSIETKDGIINPRLLFGIGHLQKDEGEVLEHHHELESFMIPLDGEVVQERVQQVFDACEPHSFMRVKGIINVVTNKWYLVNGVFGKFEWREIDAPEDRTGKIIFIGNQIKAFEPQIRDYLAHAKQGSV